MRHFVFEFEAFKQIFPIIPLIFAIVVAGTLLSMWESKWMKDRMEKRFPSEKRRKIVTAILLLFLFVVIIVGSTLTVLSVTRHILSFPELRAREIADIMHCIEDVAGKPVETLVNGIDVTPRNREETWRYGAILSGETETTYYLVTQRTCQKD